MEGDRLIGKNTQEDKDIETNSKEILGLSTMVALDILHRDIKRVLQDYEEDFKRNK